MKLTRILALPFALGADVVTLGNMGGRSFTQQIFDAERTDQEIKAITETLKAAALVVKAAKEAEGGKP